MSVGCTDLVSLETMYSYNPNFGAIPDFSPAGGTPSSTAVSDGGVACGWLQQSSGDVIEIGASSPPAAELATRRAAVAGSGSTSASGAEQFFDTSGGVGTATVFSGGYWIVASSPWFTTIGDAQPLIDSAVAALP